MTTRSDNELDDYFTRSIIGMGMGSNDAVHTVPSQESSLNGDNAPVSPTSEGRHPIHRRDYSLELGESQEASARAAHSSQPPSDLHALSASQNQPTIRPSTSTLGSQRDSSSRAFLRQEPTLGPDVNKLPEGYGDVQTRPHSVEHLLGATRARAVVSPKPPLHTDNQNKRPLSIGASKPEGTKGQPLAAEHSPGHDWIMQTNGQASPRKVKISASVSKKDSFLQKSIRMDTLIFALLGIIVSLVLLFIAYTLWLQ